jgi:hypothetical protein
MQILNPQFIPALDKLMRKSIPVSVCEELANCITEIEKKINTVQKVKSAVIDKYLVKDAKGQVVIVDDKMPKFIDDEAKQNFYKEINELLRGEFEVTFNSKIALDESDKMTAQEYVMIKDFVEIKKVEKIVDISKK